MKEHINLLGLKAVDKVTGYKGVITSISFDLYGCIQAVLTPKINNDGGLNGGKWFDIPRLEIVSKKAVMPVPDFDNQKIMEGRKGAAEKPFK